MNHYILTYKLTPTYLKERTKYREEHLELASKYLKEGNLILGGGTRKPFR